MTKKLTLTQKKILEQLQENTGRHFLDSGGAYGRHWERNQKKTWDELTQPEVCISDVYVHNNRIDLCGTIKVAAFLDAMLEYAPHLQRRYDNFVKDSEDSHMQDMLNFLTKSRLSEEYSNDTYSRRGSEYSVTYTYNHDNDLSQDIQFVMFEYDNDNYVLLQVHNGCDARGGMTSPKIYRLIDRDYFYMAFNVASYNTWVGDEHWYWDVDDTSGDGGDRNHRFPLHDTPAVVFDDKGDESFENFCLRHPNHFVAVKYEEAFFIDSEGNPCGIEPYAQLQF